MNSFKRKCFLTCAILFAFATVTFNVTADDDTGNESQSLYYTDILRLDAENIEENIACLEKLGVKIINYRDDLALAFIPYELNETTDDNSATSCPTSVKRLKGRKKHDPRRDKIRNVPTMNVAREMYDASKILYSTTGGSTFSGKGVVVGFCDIGFDSRHINFLDSKGKYCRIKKVVQIKESEGEKLVYTTPEDIYDWETDDGSNMHATHVAGILTGAYGYGSTSGEVSYHGMAPDAEIVATTSQLSDVGVLAGVEEIIDYAKSVGKPAVVNISIGSYLGPHDGTSYFCQYLDKCAEDAIICISAGNEASKNSHCVKTMSSDTDSFKVLFFEHDWTHFNMYGETMFYSVDTTPVKVKVCFIDSQLGGWGVAHDSGVIDLEKTPDYVITSYQEDESLGSEYHYDEEFAKYFTGRVYVSGGIDEQSGRYMAEVFYDTQSETRKSESEGWARYRIGTEVSGVAGQRIDAFADSSYSWFESVAGVVPKPDNAFSISDMATGHNVITVGMYCTQEGVECFNGNTFAGAAPYTVHSYSGYATLLDGRVLPATVAPGGPIVASFSTPYIRKYGDSAIGAASYKTLPQFASDDTPIQGDQTQGGHTQGVQPLPYSDDTSTGYQLYDPQQEYYWLPYSGTSMSSPYAAGVVATWLEANPKLTYKDVQKVISSTNETEIHTLAANPRHGEGYMKPYEGLMEVLKNTEVGVLDMENAVFRALFNGNSLRIENPYRENLQLSVMDISGKRCGSVSLGDEMLINISSDKIVGLSRGVNILQISSSNGKTVVMKLLINN